MSQVERVMRVVINVEVKLRATLSQKGSALASLGADGTNGLFLFLFLHGDWILLQLELLENQSGPTAAFSSNVHGENCFQSGI